MYMAAASLGLGHETYAYSPAASSGFTPDDLLVVAKNCAATMNFPPPVAMADDCFPELGVHLPGYYSPPHVFSRNETNMSFVDDGTMMMSREATRNGHDRRMSSRIGFRTWSEVDVLDDGFKWRKYGKKAVKSSPNLRNYYRCSVEGCGVKKRVERDRDDPRYVLTTYDGVHNHAAPPGHHAPPQTAAPYTTAVTLAGAPSDAWGMQQQLHAAATAHSSESSY